MKTFKQKLLAALGLIAFILLVVYVPKTQTIDLQNFNSDRRDDRITLYYLGDRVIKSVGTYTGFYKYDGIANAEEAEDIFGRFVDRPGIKWKFDFQKDRYTLTSEIDFEKVLRDKRYTNWQEFLAEDGKYVSLEKYKNSLIADGYKVIEDKKFQELPKP